MFKTSASWVWDFWFADDGERFHLFFLKASRALHDPDRRHWHATIGHAVSSGCFRLVNEEVTDLYERVPVGTKVIIRQKPEL